MLLLFVFAVVVVVVLLGGSSSKNLIGLLHRFKSDWDEIWRNFSSSRYASIGRVGYLI